MSQDAVSHILELPFHGTKHSCGTAMHVLEHSVDFARWILSRKKSDDNRSKAVIQEPLKRPKSLVAGQECEAGIQHSTSTRQMGGHVVHQRGDVGLREQDKLLEAQYWD